MTTTTINPYTSLPFAELVRIRTQLSQTTEIDDMTSFAQEWADLSEAFSAIEAPANAALCAANAQHYSQLQPGHYTIEQRAGYQNLVLVPA